MRTTVSQSGSQTPNIPLLVGLVLFAATIRWVGLVHYDLWLDELWSVLQVSELENWYEVFTTLHHDNNHITNSLWIYLVGPFKDPTLYRILPYACSILSIPIAASISIPFAILVTISYPLILYATEARGYSMMVLFVMLTIVGLEKERIRNRNILLLVSMCLGTLSHSSFLLALPGIFGYAVLNPKHGKNAFDRIVVNLPWLLPFFVFFSGLYILYFRYLEIGGGPKGSLVEVWINSVGTIFGGREISAAALDQSMVTLLIAAAATLVTLIESSFQMRAGKPLGACILLNGLIVPAFFIVMLKPEFALPRYFLVPNIFVLLAMAKFLSRLIDASLIGRFLACVLVVGAGFLNSKLVLELYRLGRGNPLVAFRTISDLSQTRALHNFSSTSDFRVGMTLKYYSRVFPELAPLSIQHGDDSQSEILLVEELDRAKGPAPEFKGRRLVATFPSAQLSGLPWYIYAND